MNLFNEQETIIKGCQEAVVLCEKYNTVPEYVKTCLKSLTRYELDSSVRSSEFSQFNTENKKKLLLHEAVNLSK